jgi:hypothetical protein
VLGTCTDSSSQLLALCKYNIASLVRRALRTLIAHRQQQRSSRQRKPAAVAHYTATLLLHGLAKLAAHREQHSSAQARHWRCAAALKAANQKRCRGAIRALQRRVAAQCTVQLLRAADALWLQRVQCRQARAGLRKVSDDYSLC